MSTKAADATSRESVNAIVNSAQSRTSDVVGNGSPPPMLDDAIEPTEVNMSVTAATTGKMSLFLTRGLVAIAWAVVFAAVSHSLTAAVTVGAGVLLVLYPLIDVVASVIDARNQRGSARQILLGDATVSTVAAVALGVAATGSVANVLAVFGVWAIITGVAQLVLLRRRRAQLGNQWPLLLSSVGSALVGIAYVMVSTGVNPRLALLAIYAAGGGAEFIVQAWLLARRRRRLAPLPARS
ncbi:MAG TPA: DUF308 domain-containing protein [Mycobacteriales bacterium]|nr:DUF308 domain-containing protein [Mycobacteriales bacterium]